MTHPAHSPFLSPAKADELIHGDRPAVPALVKSFRILELLSKEPGLGFAAIQRRLDLPKSTCHKLLATLHAFGAVQMQPDRGFVLGLRLFELGALAAGQRHIEREAWPHLRRLTEEVRLTCHLGVREGLAAVYLCKIECDRDIKVNTWVGKRLSLNSSSLGKILLAWLPESELDTVLEHLEWTGKCPNTITDAARFKEHLALVRQRGWATDDEEDALNLRCIAGPVLDMAGNVIAAVSVVGTVLDLDPAGFSALAERVCRTAEEISRALGHRLSG